LIRTSQYKFVTAVVAVVATALPALWFTSWLQKQGEAEVSITANWSIGVTDLAIERAVSSLDDLSASGVDSCKPAHLDLLRKALFAAAAMKDVAVIGADGKTLCSDLGTTFPRREILGSAATSTPGIVLDVVAIAERGERLLRVRRVAAAGKPSLAASLPVSLLLPQVGPEGSPFSGHARMTLPDETLVGVTGVEPIGGAPAGDQIVGRQQSQRYGPIVTVTMVRNGVIATYEDLRRIGMVVTGLVALMILVCAFLVPWRERQNPISEIERALKAGEFVPYYQPIVDITTGKLLGAEVLVRWRKRDGSIVMPGSFIPLVESSGLILDLTRALMRHVCDEVGPAIGLRRHMYIAFNVAPLHIADAVILDDIGSIFAGSPIGMSQLVLEVTERYEIENMAATTSVIAALQGLGCRIAIDDVGTGHSGLSYILKLGVDIIKIDKIFVEAISTERHCQAIVDTLVDLARNLRMHIVAEGVEDFEQVVHLRERGITAAQGYVFAPPLPAKAFLQLVEAIDPLAPEPSEIADLDPPSISARHGRPAAA
jgi:sensor c-di-GMP phosphodiesterase-like protein